MRPPRRRLSHGAALRYSVQFRSRLVFKWVVVQRLIALKVWNVRRHLCAPALMAPFLFILELQISYSRCHHTPPQQADFLLEKDSLNRAAKRKTDAFSCL